MNVFRKIRAARFVSKPSRTLFLTRDSPATLPDGSGCRIKIFRNSADVADQPPAPHTR
jgi:hypothetical protein